MRADALLLPIGATVRRAAKDDGTSSHLATGEGWTLRAIRYRGGSAVVTVTATTASVQTRFDDLMTRTPTNLDGRLLLLHGPPGTGKTTALRSLAREWCKWCKWCKVECIIDPETLFRCWSRSPPTRTWPGCTRPSCARGGAWPRSR